jgi:hypothetical protein
VLYQAELHPDGAESRDAKHTIAGRGAGASCACRGKEGVVIRCAQRQGKPEARYTGPT